MKVSIPEHKEHEAARKGLLLGLWADGDEFFGGTVEEVFAVEGNGVLTPGLAQGAEVSGLQGRPRRPGSPSRPCGRGPRLLGRPRQS